MRPLATPEKRALGAWARAGQPEVERRVASAPVIDFTVPTGTVVLKLETSSMLITTKNPVYSWRKG